MISMVTSLSAKPAFGALPFATTLSYALSSTEPAEQVTVTYQLGMSNDVYFDAAGGPRKTLVLARRLPVAAQAQFMDIVTLVRGAGTDVPVLLEIHQTIRGASGASLHGRCLVQVERAASQKRSGEGPSLPNLREWRGLEPLDALRAPTAELDLPGRAMAQHAAATSSRYVNAALVELGSRRQLSPTVGIAPGQLFRIRLDVGKLSRDSQVKRPQPLPELPVDVWFDVMLASSHFAVGATRRDLGKAPVVHGRFFVPRGGAAGKTPSGSRYLFFWLRAPEAPRPLPAVARVSFYYRGSVVQSVRLDAMVGGTDWELTIDYTVVEALGDLRLIPERPRLSVLTNDNGSGRHQVTVRSARGDAQGASSSTTFELDERTIGGMVRDLRKGLRDVAPLTKQRSRQELIEDLRRLAPIGWQLHGALAGQFLSALDEVRKAPDEFVIQVSRPAAASYVLPWGLLYEIFLDSAIAPGRLKVCDLVEHWDGHAPLFAGLPRRCPHAAESYHRENVLCPFGFWGLRYSVEQLTSTDRPVPEIPATSAPIMAVGLTEYDVSAKELTQHLGRLASVLAIPHVKLEDARTKQGIRDLLGQDLPLVYFYCHGERLNNLDPNTFLGIGRREQITPLDFIGWVQRWREDNKKIWDRVRPLIFINACHSAEINPDTLVSYLDAFIGTGKAAGLIGTEVKVGQTLAMELATEFFRLFSLPDYSVDRALREVRLQYLSYGNLLGLVYTPYCWADLHLVR